MIATIAEKVHPFRVARWCASRPRYEIAIVSLVFILVVGFVDYVTGPNISLSVVYLLPIAMTAWFVGQSYAIALSVLSVAIWICGDSLSPGHDTSIFVPAWNGVVLLIFYVFSVLLLARLHALQHNLNELVRERTAALTKEIRERQRLERNIMEVGNREQRRIGQDLHDGLCQHLTGTALAGHVLAEKLAAAGQAEAKEARKIVDLVEEAIAQARDLAKGVYPVEMQPEGLMQALADLAAAISESYKISCKFVCDSPVLVHSPAVAMHLYRITQEAVGNAVKHGHATEIIVSLKVLDGGTKLCVVDNGSGIATPLRDGGGIGLHVMADRAKSIGASFAIGRSMSGGAEVSCTLPHGDTTTERFDA